MLGFTSTWSAKICDGGRYAESLPILSISVVKIYDDHIPNKFNDRFWGRLFIENVSITCRSLNVKLLPPIAAGIEKSFFTSVLSPSYCQVIIAHNDSSTLWCIKSTTRLSSLLLRLLVSVTFKIDNLDALHGWLLAPNHCNYLKTMPKKYRQAGRLKILLLIRTNILGPAFSTSTPVLEFIYIGFENSS